MESLAIDLSLTASPKHAKWNLCLLQRFFWHAEIDHPDQITAGAIREYLNSLLRAGASRKTVRNQRAGIGRFCRHAVEQEVLPSNPCSLVRAPPLEQKLPRFLDRSEYNKVIRLAHRYNLLPEVGLALLTGLRKAELRHLRWEDVDLEAKALYVRKSKPRRPRVVWLSRRAKMLLRWQKRRTGGYCYVFAGWKTSRGKELRAAPRGTDWWDKALDPIRELVPKFYELPGKATGRGWHLFRHTFASRAVQAGVPIFEVSQWLGHSDVRTTQIYAHLAPNWNADIEKV